jgi:uncharacterized protein (TIGR03437 family)
MWTRVAVLMCLAAALAFAQPKRILYITHSAGFRHGSIPVSVEVLRDLAARSGTLELVATEDLSLVSSEGLSSFDAVLFFTSGELPLNTTQKADLLAFVRRGKGFGGVHSATDTFYSWPEYGELIGGWFDGHPWVQHVRIDVEDPDHPAARHLAPSFVIQEEIYQHRNFSRDRVRVLMTLDTETVDLDAEGVNRTDGDFALAWVRPYGEGRVFYSALGHFDETWRDHRFQQTMLNAMLWLTGQVEGGAAPRPPAQPRIGDNAVGNAATMSPLGTIAPGSLISIYGDRLTTGAALAAGRAEGARKLAGATVRIDGQIVPLFYASPGQINAFAPLTLEGQPCNHSAGRCIEVAVSTPGTAAATMLAGLAEKAPGIFVATIAGRVATIWATGLGEVHPAGEFLETAWRPRVLVNGAPGQVQFSGLAPGWVGLYQINVLLPSGLSLEAPIEFRLVD